jgi:hypothetical protein
MRDLIKNIEPSELLDFLVEYAQRNSKFANELRVKFAEPDLHAEIDKISALIDEALDGVSDYSRRDSWGWVHVDTSDIAFEIRERVEQGHIRLAFAALETLYLKLLEVFEYQGECEISDEAEDCLRMMSETADSADAVSDQEYIYEHCIELAYKDEGKNYGADYEDKLLDIASRFVTRNNCAKLENALSQFETSWRGEEFKLIRLTMIRRLDGAAAADAFIAANLKYPKVREIAYATAIERQDYAEAERLCVGAANEPGGRDTRNWLYKLYAVYERVNDCGKQADTAERILLLGDLEYYDKLKTLLTDDARWDNEYPALLKKCAEQLSFTQYMRILNSENEFELLLGQLRLHQEQVYDYSAALTTRYGDDVHGIFLAQINSEAEKANCRDAYRKVCEHIEIFAAAGYASSAAKLIMDCKLRYKRRPAFVDELRQAEEKL